MNWLQRLGLNWLMNREFEDDTKLEKIRTENMALASNQLTSPKFIEHIMKNHEENLLEEEIDGEKIDWRTPTSVEEVQDVLEALGLKATKA